jgi:DNA-binding LacI/PurR family transcriptional regulator
VLSQSELHMLIADGRLDRRSDQRLMRAFTEMRVDGLILADTMAESTAINDATAWLPTVVAGSRDFKVPDVDVVA